MAFINQLILADTFRHGGRLKTGMRVTAILFFFGSLSLRASLLYVQSSVSWSPGDPPVMQVASDSKHFALTITGGSGMGRFLPIFQVSGMLKPFDQRSTFDSLGAYARVVVGTRTDINIYESGNPFDWEPVGTFSIPGPGPESIPFTYGEPLDVRVFVTTEAEVRLHSGQTSTQSFSPMAFAEFDGISLVNDGIPHTVEITETPEPGNSWLAFSAVLYIWVISKRRHVNQRPSTSEIPTRNG